MGIKVVSDSSSNVFSMPDIEYQSVPLKIMFGGREYVDEPGTDFEKMVLDLQEHRGPSTTSCPNVLEWLNAFAGHDEIFGITISSGLSASFAAAEMAARQYMEENPIAKVHIIDSKATGATMRLIIERLRNGIVGGKSFEQILEDVGEYFKRTRILYALESLNNLANNGRVNMHVARVIGALNVRIIGHASDEGTIELLHKCRGEKRTLKTIVREMAERGYAGGNVHIDHCLNLPAAEKLKALIKADFPDGNVGIGPCTGLCSYYADKGGLIIGYEVD
jgi:DegV family protein with EDD domain